MGGGLLPIRSLLFERNKSRHSYLRRLVGAALTPQAVEKAAPLLQASAEEQVDRVLRNPNNVKFSKICTDYTLDVAWRQILGLELTPEEIPVFEQNVAQWIKGVMSLRVLFKVAVKSSPGYKAHQELIGKIEERIDQLLKDGPDHKSTLSGMVFATDDSEDSKEKLTKRLSREEIIDNALILIFAGSETSASTLTNAMLFLGLNPYWWRRLAEEQEKIKQLYSENQDISMQMLNDAPILDAVLKETLRMRTVVGGIPRTTLTDIEVDGVVIPKGWLIDPSMLLTHEHDPACKLPNREHLDAIKGFQPDRWLSDQKPTSDWYVPYGFGPRYCLGKNLAQLEMKMFLATMVRKISKIELNMAPDGYYKHNQYFPVEWSKSGAVIPTPADGVLASATAKTNDTKDVINHEIETSLVNDPFLTDKIAENDTNIAVPVLSGINEPVRNTNDTSTFLPQYLGILW